MNLKGGYKMTNIRCKKCNWLNKEVTESFICSNCGKESITIKQPSREIINTAQKEDKK